MRGANTFTKSLFTLCQLQDFIPKSHPLRPIRQTVNAALIKMDALFSRMCEDDIKGGAPARPPSSSPKARWSWSKPAATCAT
ncbi:MAG: hypothetical protein K2X51_01960 [Burkholderiales bacterium]|nr:hypothetical protein [Burkholderiales bacterium]